MISRHIARRLSHRHPHLDLPGHADPGSAHKSENGPSQACASSETIGRGQSTLRHLIGVLKNPGLSNSWSDRAPHADTAAAQREVAVEDAEPHLDRATLAALERDFPLAGTRHPIPFPVGS